MRFLLVQVPTSHLGAGERVYPLGLARLSGLIPEGHDKQALDMNRSLDPWQDLKARLLTFRPDRVLLSFRNIDPLAGQQTSYLASLKTAARMSRLLVPDARIWAGGPAFSLFPERLMTEIPEIDVGLVGEGERALPQMTAGGGGVPGTLWREGGKIRRSPAGAPVDMNALPPPDTAAFSPADYLEGNRYVAVMGIEGKRGCDLSCAYCVYPGLGGRRMRLRDPERIVDEMETLHRGFGVEWFHFTDG
ncbi:B12-binding domain-containing radical SAM protein, partial [Desulfococcus sp.]